MDTPPSGRLKGSVHLFPVRVYYEDTDAGGIVYHPAWLRFAERARSELFRCLGIPPRKILEETGVSFVVRHCEIDFRAPARLDDSLVVMTQLESLSGATIVFRQDIGRTEDTILAQMKVRLAALSATGRPVRIPAAARQEMEGLARAVPGTGGKLP
ncbi:MAG: YbgC/FadM family acyl-CoA thioesterase [Pseudomonadota bacterium]|nr:YbgC/FadM family acyl-CoA thioesterase [Pseudomonadota bacterium]